MILKKRERERFYGLRHDDQVDRQTEFTTPREWRRRRRDVDPLVEKLETVNYLCLAQQGYFISWQMIPFPAPFEILETVTESGLTLLHFSGPSRGRNFIAYFEPESRSWKRWAINSTSLSLFFSSWNLSNLLERENLNRSVTNDVLEGFEPRKSSLRWRKSLLFGRIHTAGCSGRDATMCPTQHDSLHAIISHGSEQRAIEYFDNRIVCRLFRKTRNYSAIWEKKFSLSKHTQGSHITFEQWRNVKLG